MLSRSEVRCLDRVTQRTLGAARPRKALDPTKVGASKEALDKRDAFNKRSSFNNRGWEDNTANRKPHGVYVLLPVSSNLVGQA